MNSQSQKKLLGYSTSACSFLLLSQGANAQIIYTDLDPDVFLSPYYDDQYLLDIDNDGVNDVNFKLYQFGFTMYVGYDYLAELEPLYGNKIAYIYDSSFRECSSWLNIEKVVPVIEAEDTIDSAMQFMNELAIFASISHDDYPCYDSGQQFGSWLEKTGMFAAVEIHKGSLIYYGWIRLSMNEWYEITIEDYAYESIPGIPIIAGRTSGTTAIATSPASNLYLDDISDFGDGRDLQLSFDKAADESNINEYRIYLVNSSIDLFNVDSALQFSDERYKKITPTGEDIILHFDETTLDISGNPISYDTAYYAYVLSYNSTPGYPMQLSNISNEVILYIPLTIETPNDNLIFYINENGLIVQNINESSQPDFCEILDMNGKKVFKSELMHGENTLPLNYAAGVYLFTLISEGKLYSKKFILK